MTSRTLTEGAPTLVGSGYESEQETAAEQYGRLLEALTSGAASERSAAATALVESGSGAVFPLLRLVEDEGDYKVASAALWSLLRLTDDLLGDPSGERDTPSAVLQRGRLTDKYLRLGLEAVQARSTAGSPAKTALGWTYYVDETSRAAALRFFKDLIRHAPDLDPELPAVLDRLARRHPFPGLRRRGAELRAMYEARPASDETTDGTRAANRLADRRESVRIVDDASEGAISRLLAAVTSDPDRQVRHIAATSLYRLLRSGARIRVTGTVPFVDREVRFLFTNGETELWALGSAAKSLSPLMGLDEHTRRCVLPLLAHLRPALNDLSGAELDEFIREAMRDKDREVRRDATAVARVATTDYIQTELADRLRERLRLNPPKLLFLALGIQVVFGVLVPLALIPHVRGITSLAMLMCGLTQLVSVLSHRTGKHRVTNDDYLETLQAMEPVANVSPERLQRSLPELRKLAGFGAISPEVRAKARELLAKVHEATLHELPIAATAPVPEPQTLPVPATPPEQQAARP